MKQMKPKIKQAIKSQIAHIDKELDFKEKLLYQQSLLNTTEKWSEGDTDKSIKKCIKYLKRKYKESKNIHETPISLTECILPQVCLIRLKHSSIKSYKSSIDEESLTQPFFLVGEILQASGHVIITSLSTQKTYSMIHTSDLEVIPPQDF